jgi:hypothetical protein
MSIDIAFMPPVWLARTVIIKTPAAQLSAPAMSSVEKIRRMVPSLTGPWSVYATALGVGLSIAGSSPTFVFFWAISLGPIGTTRRITGNVARYWQVCQAILPFIEYRNPTAKTHLFGQSAAGGQPAFMFDQTSAKLQHNQISEE